MQRVLVLDDGVAAEVFEVLGITDGVARVRSALLFEIGEELVVRIEGDGPPTEATARVRGHVGTADSRITELELTDRAAPQGA